MRLTASNSGCCGVRYIRDFPQPGRMLPEIEESGYTFEINNTSEPEAYLDLSPVAPREAALERFKRLVAFVQKKQKAGIIQCYLAVSGSIKEYNEPYAGCANCNCHTHCNSYPMWKPILEEMGFTLQHFFNSNSENDCAVFTLVYGSRETYEGPQDEDDYYDSEEEDY